MPKEEFSSSLGKKGPPDEGSFGGTQVFLEGLCEGYLGQQKPVTIVQGRSC